MTTTSASTKTTDPLLTEFSPATEAEWRVAAEEALAGAPFEKKLVTRTPEGVDLQPIYSQTNTAEPRWSGSWPGLAPFVRGSEPLGVRADGWLICQNLGCSDPAAFNRALRDDLNRGQNAVLLPLGCTGSGGLEVRTLADLERALQGVDLSAVPVHVPAGVSALPVAAMLLALAKRQGLQPAQLQGAVLADPLTALLDQGRLPGGAAAAYTQMARLVRWTQSADSPLAVIGIDAGRWADAGASAVQELAFGLATGVDYLRELEKQGVAADVAAPRCRFTWSLGSHFFIEIAKLRAARLLWSRALAAAGAGPAAQRLVSHGRTSRWNKTVLDPHNNLLRATTEACAGVVGGCASLEVAPFDACWRTPDDFSRRLARNIQVILAEECQLGRVIDPAGGSHYVETVTGQLAEKAWALFQEIERRGGMTAAVVAGYPQELVAKTAADRLAAVEGRRDGVIGTNLHPNLRETMPAPVPRAMPAAQPAGKDADKKRLAAIINEASDDPAALLKRLKEALVVGATLDEIVEALRPANAVTEAKSLPSLRRAEVFEALRRRAEAHLAATGSRPKVYLANFGPRKQHAARADFSTGFFAAGGFEVVSGKSVATSEEAAPAALAAGAPVVVICSTDETYPQLVPPLVAALKAAPKPPVVVLAGLPAPEVQQQFKAAGVDEFIHIRANCAKLLAGLQDRLGLTPSPRS